MENAKYTLLLATFVGSSKDVVELFTIILQLLGGPIEFDLKTRKDIAVSSNKGAVKK